MAPLTQDDVDRMRDTLREKYNYDDMTDDHKMRFDSAFESRINEYREEGLIEDNNDDGTDPEDNGDNGEEDDGVMGNEMGRGRDQDKNKGSSENEYDDDPVSKSEYEQMDAQIPNDQERIDAERQRREEEAEKSERDHGDRSR